jgi:hypothetical protein
MEEIQKALKERYSSIHPLLFHRSVERAKTDCELFDLLDGMPMPPLIWDEKSREWRHTDDLLQRKTLDEKGGEDD